MIKFLFIFIFMTLKRKIIVFVAVVFLWVPCILNAQNIFKDTILVGVAGNPPFVVDTTLGTGISIEIWDALAGNLNIPYNVVNYKDIPEVLYALEKGKIQVAVGPIGITAERAEKVLFSQPYFQSSLSIMSANPHPTLWGRIHPFFSERFFIAVILFIFILAVVGTCLWLAERRENPKQFPKSPSRGIANGMWCAIATMTTTGYGDVAPKTFWGRFAAGAWMIISLIFATSLVAGISSVLTISGINKNSVTSPRDLSGKIIAVPPSSSAEAFVKENGGRVKPVINIAAGDSLLTAQKVNAIVFDRSELLYYQNSHPDQDMSISGGEYQKVGYGFAFSMSQHHIHDIDVALLELSEGGVINSILQKWIGYEMNK